MRLFIARHSHPLPTPPQPMKRIVVVLLAAGASQRFGADKLIQPLASGLPVAVQACQNLMAATDEVLAILRPGNERLATLLRAEGANVAYCIDAWQGMGATLASGIRHRPTADGWIIALADMPWINPQTIRGVADALRAGATIAAPCLQGRRGHPVGFANTLAAELTTLNGDQGAKAIINAYPDQLTLIDSNDLGILQDIDLPGDLTNQ